MKTKYDPICDMFSLGLIFHILLLGNSAFPGKTYNEVLAQNRASNISLDGEEYKKLDQDAVQLMGKMLKKSPQDRITAVDALNHPYFNNHTQDHCDEEGDTVAELHQGGYPSCDSPLLTSSNSSRKQDKMIKKDSCVDFKMGKENVFTGKVETVGEMGSMANNSAGKRFESVVMPKVSKFSAKK